MKYWIHEDNMERLVKKLSVIANKCRKYNTEFKFEITGEEQLRKNKDDLGYVSYVRYVEVEAEGIAKIADWEFVATIQHNEPMNIVRCFLQNVEVPHEYFTAKPFCDHCKTRRYRKDTYIIRNTKTGEFKQVGKSCLLDYTHGLSAEAVAQYISWFDEIIKGEAPMEGYKVYDDTKEVLQYAVEAVRLFGYVKADDWGDSTKSVVMSCVHRSSFSDKYFKKGFDPDHEGNAEKTQAILDWAKTLTEDYGYKSNLKSVLSKEGCEGRDYGLICSAVIAYAKEVEKIERKKREQQGNTSEWVGKIGDRICIDANSTRLLTSWSTEFGMTYLYKFTDASGNVFTWKTGKWLFKGDEADDTLKVSLKGTIKAHNEYNGVKQTELTRCKVV